MERPAERQCDGLAFPSSRKGGLPVRYLRPQGFAGVSGGPPLKKTCRVVLREKTYFPKSQYPFTQDKFPRIALNPPPQPALEEAK